MAYDHFLQVLAAHKRIDRIAVERKPLLTALFQFGRSFTPRLLMSCWRRQWDVLR